MAKELTEGQLSLFIDDLVEEFWQRTGENASQTFKQRVLNRRLAFDSQNPVVFKGRLKDLTPFKSDTPRQKWSELRSRITENHFRVRIRPVEDIASQRSDANETEAAFLSMIEEIEQRNGKWIQQALSDGQGIDGLAILHWRKIDDHYPDYPEAIEVEILPDDEDDRKRYSKRRKNGVYVETPDSVRGRRMVDCAKAGAPWVIETPDPLACLWRWDEFGIGMFIHIKFIPLWQYAIEAGEDKEFVTSVNDADPDQPIYRSKPIIPEMTSVDRRQMVAVATVWTRTHWYELYQENVASGVSVGTGWQLVQSVEHDYEDIPFAIVPAFEIENRAPADAYLSPLEGLFRLKGSVDRSMSLMLGLQEQAALKMFYLERIADGEPMMGEDGSRIMLDSDAAAAMKIPDGYRLQEITNDVSPGFVNAVGVLMTEYQNAAPKTGRMDIGGSTSPWTVKLGLEMENTEPRKLIFNQMVALQRMAKSMFRKMAKEEEPTYVFAKVTEGKVEKKKIVAIYPEKIGSLDIDIDIDPTSGAENVSMVEHGVSLVERGYIHTIDFLENYMKKPDPDKYYAALEAWKYFQQNVQPLLLKQEMAERLAGFVTMGPNGTFVGAGGVEVSPEEVLQQNGQQPLPPQQPQGQPPMPPMPPAMGGPTGGGAAAGAIPPMPPLAAPNDMMLPGRTM